MIVNFLILKILRDLVIYSGGEFLKLYLVVTVFVVMFVCSCGTINIMDRADNFRPEKLCVAENKDVSGRVLSVIEQVLRDKNINYDIVSDIRELEKCNAVFKYRASWKRDTVRYWTYINLSVYLGEEQVGVAVYDSRTTKGDFDEWVKKEFKVKEMAEEMLN